MARTRPAHRLTKVLDAAADVFMRNGYRGARVDQIAELAGVAPGTIYLLAASKEALFDLVIRREFGAPMLTDDAPYEVLRPAALVDQLWDHLQSVALFPALDAALASNRISDATGELEGIVAELYRWIATYWRGLRIAERCATEWPELSLLWLSRRESFWRWWRSSPCIGTPRPTPPT
jgi:AcrR family transcriptional regulator